MFLANHCFHLFYQYLGVRPITTELYKMCLIYTVRSKIAPQWNIAAQYFLLGKEFYSSVQAIGAVKLDILIDGIERSN